jgi:hypothetical protein
MKKEQDSVAPPPPPLKKRKGKKNNFNPLTTLDADPDYVALQRTTLKTALRSQLSLLNHS